MARPAPGDPDGGEERIRLLTGAYRTILARYREIERLSCRERDILRERGPIREVIEVLRAKREHLRAIRVEEESVSGVREWWKRSRRSLPASRGQELLSLLDAIARRLERNLALEAECRGLLDRALAWGNGEAGAALAATGAATLAYRRENRVRAAGG